MTAILSSINLIAKNIDSDLYDNGEAFCRFHHSTIVGSRVLLLRVVPVNEVRPAVCVAAPSALGFACGLTGTLLLLAGVY